MAEKKEYIKILKPKDRPVQIEPWFFRYLNAGQLKVLSAIIAHADYATRSKDSFASNKTLAFYAGFGLINPDTKDYDHYQSLNDEDRAAFKKEKMNNAIQTVKNIKRDLEKLGVITREISGTKSYAVVDLEWGKERYLKEFDEYFNENEKVVESSEDEIQAELQEIMELSEEGNISKGNLASKLEELSKKIKSNMHNSSEPVIPKEDIDKTVEHYMNTDLVKNKIAKGTIKNPEGYRTISKTKILNNTFNGVEKYYQGLVQKERAEILEILFSAYHTKEYKDELFMPYEPMFDKDFRTIIIHYVNGAGTQRAAFAVTPDLIADMLTPENYTTDTQEFIKNYEKNYILASEQNKGGKKDLRRIA